MILYAGKNALCKEDGSLCTYLDNHLFQEDAPCTLTHIQKSSWLRPSECNAVYLSEFYTSMMNH